LKHLICIPLNESWKKEDVKRTVSAVEKSMRDLASKEVAVSVEIRERERATPRSVSAEKEGKKIRIGIIGCGQMGRWHLDAYKGNRRVELIAFADTEFDRARSFAREVGAKAYSSHLEMLKSEKLDGISICTLPATHKEITLDVLNAGVHVLCEKPLAISVAEAEEMSRKADEKRLLLLTAFKFRFFDEVMRAKELVQKGSLGDILNFRLMFGGFMDLSGTWYVRKELSGGGVIMDNGPHAVDLVRFLFGEIEAIEARISHRLNGAVEDTAKLTMGLKTGAVGTCDLSWSFSAPSKTYFEIYGEDGTVLLDLEGMTYKFNTWNEWKRISNQTNGKEAFARQIDHFVGAISQKPTIVKNEDGPKSQMIIDAAYESVKQDRKISLSEV
jgi:predicted dehydrogenase